MFIATVVGTVVSTRKIETLVGSKFLIIEPRNGSSRTQSVAVDNIGAGVGDIVLVTTGSAARISDPAAPIDELIIGIVDDVGKIMIGK